MGVLGVHVSLTMETRRRSVRSVRCGNENNNADFDFCSLQKVYVAIVWCGVCLELIVVLPRPLPLLAGTKATNHTIRNLNRKAILKDL